MAQMSVGELAHPLVLLFLIQLVQPLVHRGRVHQGTHDAHEETEDVENGADEAVQAAAARGVDSELGLLGRADARGKGQAEAAHDVARGAQERGGVPTLGEISESTRREEQKPDVHLGGKGAGDEG